MIRISFIIATYNRAGGVVATLQSIYDQTLPREMYEVVVADNNSRDNTEARFREFAASHPDMHLVYCFEPQQGLSFARNCAIEHSRGDILVVVDDDELIERNLASTYLSFFDTTPRAAAAGGVVVPLYGVELPRWFSPYIDELISGAFYLGDKIKLFPDGRYPRGGNFAVRRTMIDHYGQFNTMLGRKGKSAMGGEEKDLLGRLKSGGEPIYYLPGAIIQHIIPDNKVTKEYFERLTRMIGVTERVRTRGSGVYVGRCIWEIVKWCGALVLSLGYTLKGGSIKGAYLIKMRWNITRGLLGIIKE